MTRREILPLCFDDLALGDEWESPRRTVTESDVVNFAGVSGDFNPIHIDHDTSSRGPFGKPIAHGLLGLAIASGLTSHDPRVDTLAFLGILEWKFLQPIFFGDTIQVYSKVTALEPRARGRRGVVTWHRRLVNQNGETLQEGMTQTLVHGKRKSGESEPDSEPVE